MPGLPILLLSLSTLIPMAYQRNVPAAVALPDGRVLVAGGSSSARAVEIYDPVADAFAAAGDTSVSRNAPTGTLLPDGKVLVAAGGALPDFRGFPFGQHGDATTDLYDPATGSLTAGPSLLTSRDFHTATLLPDGRLLLAGGEAGSVGGFHYAVFRTANVEVFDPLTGTSTPDTPLLTPRSGHAAVGLGDGRILFVGGVTESELPGEIYDPTAHASIPVPGLEPRAYGVFAARLLDGRVLIGGGTASGAIPPAELYDPASGNITRIASPLGRRAGATITPLPDGDFLVAGGTYDRFQPTADVARFSRSCDCFREMPPLAVPRSSHAAVLLPDGRVLMIGGGRADAEVYGVPRRARAVAR